MQYNHREFGNVVRQKKQLLEELKTLDAKDGDFGLSDGENCHRAEFEVPGGASSLLGRNFLETKI